MKVNTVNLTYLLIGMTFGGVSGYLITDLLVYKKLERDFNKTADESGKYILNFDESDEFKVEESGQYVINEKAIKGLVKDYTKYSKSKAELKELVKKYQSMPDSIIIVNLEEFEGTEFSYPHETITYYELDSVFSKDNDEVVDNSQELFGPNIHLHFGEKSEDDDIVYVCNHDLGLMFEIVRVHSSYKVMILGEPEPEPKPTKSASKRRKVAPVVEEPDDDYDRE